MTAIYLSSGVVEDNIVYIIYVYIYNVYCTYGTVYTGSHTAIRHFSDSYCVRGRRLYYYIVGRGGDLLSIIHTERCVHYVHNIYINIYTDDRSDCLDLQ